MTQRITKQKKREKRECVYVREDVNGSGRERQRETQRETARERRQR